MSLGLEGAHSRLGLEGAHSRLGLEGEHSSLGLEEAHSRLGLEGAYSSQGWALFLWNDCFFKDKKWIYQENPIVLKKRTIA